jgi:hypothetical protein
MRCAAGILMLVLSGCMKTPADPATPPDRVTAPQSSTPFPTTAPEITATPMPLPRSEAPRLPNNVAELDARFHARSATPKERDEIIQTLGRLGAPQALPTLRRIFEEEKRLELRMRVLEVAADLPTEPGRWELFARATEARQPVVMRLSAMQTLADSEDPRVRPLLQQLARDPSADIRENAARILKERQW